MTNRFVITATGTGIGKTLISALLMQALGARYWKPVQCGTLDGTDRQTVQMLTGLPEARFFPEAYVFEAPLSPHRAAEMEHRAIDFQKLHPPECAEPLLIEGAGGLMVPLSRDRLFIDVFAEWKIPVVLCASTTLGTINHTLMSVETLKARGIPLRGLVFTGPDNADNIRTIATFSGASVLGHVPPLERVDAGVLQSVFERRFDKESFHECPSAQA